MSFKAAYIFVATVTILSMAGYAFADMTIIGPNPAGDKKTMADTIDAMSKNLSCNEDKDCKSIGFGDKPCGGFQTYKIYSTKTLNESDFIDLVKDYNDWDKEDNRQSGMVSTCDMTIEPAVSCVQGQCAALATGAPTAQ